jgi:pantoate--beta-alanine ligase
LHEGHLSLIRKANKENNIVVVSIFVNPMQFGPADDFKRYPRPFKQDAALCRKEGVDFVFYPGPEQMYPPGFKTYVDVFELGDFLCGPSRPGHFRAVTTVVSKLFNIVLPAAAYFGQKDAQQAVLIQRMVKDLNIPVKIKVIPTAREKNGLALSSRNVYLSASDRKDSVVLSLALKSAKKMILSGRRNADKIIESMKKLIAAKKNAKIEYISIVDLENLKPLKKIGNKCLVALAVRFGKTRLIDNIIIKS